MIDKETLSYKRGFAKGIEIYTQKLSKGYYADEDNKKCVYKSAIKLISQIKVEYNSIQYKARKISEPFPVYPCLKNKV